MLISNIVTWTAYFTTLPTPTRVSSQLHLEGVHDVDRMNEFGKAICVKMNEFGKVICVKMNEFGKAICVNLGVNAEINS